jgi:branched-subunit amino acid aminotransferase/4-amino-4-deoxychorismate lyase
MPDPQAYVHPQFVPAGSVRLSLHDAGIVWGATVTDRLRTFNGRLFRLDDHLRRFRESCRTARVRVEVTDERITEVSNQLAVSNREPAWELSLVWVATPGTASRFATAPDMRLPSFVAYTESLTPLTNRRIRQQGVRLLSRPCTLGVDPHVKHRSRLAWWIATEEVREIDQDADPLLLDPGTGAVLETPTANIVAVLDGVLVSPPRASVLDGVSLRVVEELSRTLGLTFEERRLTLADLGRASEVLLTNTTYCLAGVSRLDDAPVTYPGPILARLLDSWSELVGVDLPRPATGT